ncbi:MAG: hypothetical protein ACOC5B_01115 [Myxococcota bacterium]
MILRAALLALLTVLPSVARAQIEPARGGVRADGIAAVVGGTAPGPDVDVILQSDVDLRARIHLAGQTGGPLPTGPVPVELRRATLDEIVGEALIAREAARVRVAEPSAEEVAEEMTRLERRAGGADRLERILRMLGTSRRELDAVARRRAAVQAFLRANLEGSTVISDAELERVYEAGDHPYAGRPLEEITDELRAWLSRRALQRAVRRWVSVLRARTPVRLLAPYAEQESD